MFDLLCSLEPFRRYLERPGEDQGHRQAEEKHENDRTQYPVGNLESREGRVGNLDQKPGDNDVHRTDLEDVPACHLAPEIRHASPRVTSDRRFNGRGRAGAKPLLSSAGGLRQILDRVQSASRTSNAAEAKERLGFCMRFSNAPKASFSRIVSKAGCASVNR